MLSISKIHYDASRAVFKWLSKVITSLQSLLLVIGLKDSRQFFNQWEAEAKPKPIAPCTRHFCRASSELQVIARNCDWFIALPAPVVIVRSNCFGFGFSTVIWKPLYKKPRKKKQAIIKLDCSSTWAYSVSFSQSKRHNTYGKLFRLEITKRSIALFTITAESSRAHWLIFIVNKRTDMKFIIYAMLTQRARAENLKSRSVTF